MSAIGPGLGREVPDPRVPRDDRQELVHARLERLQDPDRGCRHVPRATSQAVRAIGGDVIPSFGGWSADQGGTEIGDSCKTVANIAAAYEQVITTYDVTRLDMDIEGRSITKADGIDRRNKAIKILQDWAAANGRTVQIQYTLPTSRDGLEASGLAVLQNAEGQRRPGRRRQPDGLRLLRPGEPRHGRLGHHRAAGHPRPARPPSIRPRRAPRSGRCRAPRS